MIISVRNSNSDLEEQWLQALEEWLQQHYPTMWVWSSTYWYRRSKFDYLPLSRNVKHIKLLNALSTSEIVHLKMFWDIVAIRLDWESKYILWEADA